MAKWPKWHYFGKIYSKLCFGQNGFILAKDTQNSGFAHNGFILAKYAQNSGFGQNGSISAKDAQNSGIGEPRRFLVKAF